MSKIKHEGKVQKVTTPSQFGSHSCMVIDKPAYDNYVWCKDDLGEYLTLKSRIDNGLADPNRWNRAV